MVCIAVCPFLKDVSTVVTLVPQGRNSAMGKLSIVVCGRKHKSIMLSCWIAHTKQCVPTITLSLYSVLLFSKSIVHIAT